MFGRASSTFGSLRTMFGSANTRFFIFGAHPLFDRFLDRLLVHSENENTVIQGQINLESLQQTVGRFGFAAVDVIDEDSKSRLYTVLRFFWQ